jgi:HK97 family phage prohead protease
MAQVTGGRFDHLTILPFEVDKAAREEGPNGRPRLRVRGWASTEGEDLDREFIHVGAFDDHLGDFLRNPQMVWMHERGDTQGLWETVRPETGKGYWVEGYMVHLGGEQDDRRFAMVEEGLVRGLSVGFNGRYSPEFGHWDMTDSDGYPTRDSKWHWTKGCRLMEVSLCNIPCNPGATIELAKAAGLQITVPDLTRGADHPDDLPIAPCLDQAWDAAAAGRRMAKWAQEAGDTAMTRYQLPCTDVIDGEVRVVWRGVVQCMAGLFDGRRGMNVPDADRPGIYRTLCRYYAKFGMTPPEYPAPGEPIAWKSGEKTLLEEFRALEDTQRLSAAATSLGNITRHWQREGGAPSAAVVTSAVSAITAATGIVKAAEALSDAHSADLQQAAETLGGVLGHGANKRAAREETDDKGLAIRIVR